MSEGKFLSEVMGAGAAFFDYDNDGDLDITRDGAYRAAGNRKLNHPLFVRKAMEPSLMLRSSRLADKVMEWGWRWGH